jgi:endoglucanase
MGWSTTLTKVVAGIGLLGVLGSCSAPVDDERSAESTWQALLQDGDAAAIAPPSAAASTAAPRYCSDCASVPLAYWQFDDCNAQSTQLADSANTSAITHPAFRAVSAACTAGHQGQAIQLSGGDDIVYSPDQPDYDFSQGLTVAAWINPSTVNRTQSIVRKRLDGTSSFALAIDAKRVQFVLRLTNGRLAGVTAPIHAGRFTHVAGTYDGKHILLYVNGSVAAQAAATGTIAPGVGPIFIGNDANGRQFKGVVDDVWLNTLAAPAASLRNLLCAHLPPVLAISPSDSQPVPPNVPVAFDLSVTNPNDPAFCPADTFTIYTSVPYPLTTDTYYDTATVDPGQTIHKAVNISANDAGMTGPIPFQIVAYTSDYQSYVTATATFEIAPPQPVTRTGCPTTPSQPVAPGGYYVNGNTLCTADGRAHLFHGVARMSPEWNSSGVNISAADFRLMGSWNANVVRVPLNQDFWLTNSPQADPYYPAFVDDIVAWAEMAGMDVILDLHWSDQGVLGSCTSTPNTTCQQLMPDTNSLTFWTQVASRYKNDGRVQFELYNEPHDVGWDVWRNGGETGAGWQAVGMQQLYDAVRATGANNLVLIGGLDWAYDLSGVPANRIQGYNIAYATHPYLYGGTVRPPSDWGRAWEFLTYTDPVIATEFGVLNDTACSIDYYAQVIQQADAHFAGWTAWVWFPGTCNSISLISDWSGTPTETGNLVKTALLGYNDPPASPPLPSTGGPDVNFTFDRQPQGWVLNNYADTNYTNLGAGVPSGSSPPSVSINSLDGNPNPGSLQITAPFTAFDQYVDPVVNIGTPGLNLIGKTLHAYVRLASGSLAQGGLHLHASTGSNWTWGSTEWVNGDSLSAGSWVPLTLDLSAVTQTGFDPSQVVQIGIQFYSGFSSNGGTYANGGPVVLEIDTVTD